MDLGAFLLGVGSSLFGLFFVSRLPHIWRNELPSAYDPDDVPGGWPYGGALWRGMIRLISLTGPFALAIGVTIVLDSIDRGPVVQALWLLGAGVGFVLGCLGLSVVFFNRPKWVVAPHFRPQPGAVQEWLGAAVPRTPRPSTRKEQSGQRRTRQS